jgi:hypothetical protein
MVPRPGRPFLLSSHRDCRRAARKVPSAVDQGRADVRPAEATVGESSPGFGSALTSACARDSQRARTSRPVVRAWLNAPIQATLTPRPLSGTPPASHGPNCQRLIQSERVNGDATFEV